MPIPPKFVHRTMFGRACAPPGSADVLVHGDRYRLKDLPSRSSPIVASGYTSEAEILRVLSKRRQRLLSPRRSVIYSSWQTLLSARYAVFGFALDNALLMYS
ncbi:hypothetical protein AGR13a_Lc10003 [Agrobacterium genomosp. 13 str. CFBP 6927]|uniref:Uncharacterized protein n=1 Tax=Agrobacterium genomosp. 13 str. CFBP 6927 TaxID=1183428 RepID=A0ABP2BJG7_9HYPH|nr:hypothetical protein AGR13a_Lc10003 [Agrobacterium genomosp. 13 str. CFBP 6927]